MMVLVNAAHLYQQNFVDAVALLQRGGVAS